MARTPKPAGSEPGRRRKATSYNRLSHYRLAGECILVVCEGTETEYDYFDFLRSQYTLPTIQVEICTSYRGSAPISVVDCAIQKRLERASLTRQGSFQPEYDAVWCVFDIENPADNPSLYRAIDKARGNDIHLAISNPAFEFWYLLHFVETSRGFANGTEVKDELRNHLPGYEESFRDFDRLFGNTQLAIERAQRVYENHPDDTPAPNPSTLVFRLVKKLGSMAPRR